ncbi:adenosine deaminase family protein [Legionella spiritensis]|uniref:adenosine deaminase n=1 Tax=Legionella spiritensis TaxID=452 RepID=A0A0W0ZAG4_LEGSP|nr:adenosine deaminase [Legionella spiritensis]KTD65886.1 adenosine deaminase [Legionella spiritensis]SNV32040.1 adenosine deaminase [Legionella spiritensis]
MIRNVLLLVLLLQQSLCIADVNQYFNRIKQDPNELYTFLKNMPKGGELHFHLAGSAYPESMLQIAAQHQYCLNTNNWSMTPITEHCDGIPAKKLEQYPDLYAQTIKAWSMKDFMPGLESGHDHFFASFEKFLPIVVNQDVELLAEVMQRAANQQEQYMEIMILPDNANSMNFQVPEFTMNHLAQAQKQLLADPAFRKNINDTANKVDHTLENVHQFLGCKKSPQKAACQLTVTFQFYVLREQPLEKVFAQALTAFETAAKSRDLVGVNLVQPEDGIISLRDYHQQMKIFAFLHQSYPDVAIALHAGELAPQAVLPDDLRFHIRDAVMTGHAQRIGHGVDIAHEEDAEKLLRLMKDKHIAVEINLISNKHILNITGKNHPLRYYLNHNVPVVLSTDDEGVLRTDLTTQYVTAVTEHDVDYPALKQINRNALTFSFLPGKSIWADAGQAVLTDACKDLNSKRCQRFAASNDKARLQRQLEIKLASFENQYKNSR